MLNRVEIRALTWPFQNIQLFLTIKNSWVAFAVCFVSSSICTMQCRPINFVPFDWIWAESISLFTSGFTQLLLSSVTPLIQNTPITQRHAITLLHHVSQMVLLYMFGSWAVPSLLHTCFFPSFWYRLILISAIPECFFQNWSGFFICVLAKSNLAFFAPCSEPTVFALVKSSLNCRLWQWHIYFLESVLHLAGCCEMVFIYHREDFPIIHLCCPPWTSRLFYVAELTSELFFSIFWIIFLWIYQTVVLATLNVPAISLMDVFCFWSLTLVCFTCMERSFDRMMWVHCNSFQMQMSHLQSTPELWPA